MRPLVIAEQNDFTIDLLFRGHFEKSACHN